MIIQKKSALFILLACFIWALDLVVRYPVTLKLSYVHIIFLESLLGLIVVLPWIVMKSRQEAHQFTKQSFLLFMVIGGVGMTVAGYLSTSSIQEATPGTFSFFQIFQPLLVIYLAHVFLKEKFDNLYVYWGMWVILSSILMFSQDLELMFATEGFATPTQVAVAVSTTLIWGASLVAAKKLLNTHSPMTLVAYRWVFAFLFSLIFLPFQKESIPWDLVFEWEFLWRFIFMSAVAGALAMYFYYEGLKTMVVGKVSFIKLAFPAFGMILSAFYTFDRLSVLQILGAASFFIFIAILFFYEQKKATV